VVCSFVQIDHGVRREERWKVRFEQLALKYKGIRKGVLGSVERFPLYYGKKGSVRLVGL